MEQLIKTSEEKIKKEKPLFLKILCILSFINCGLFILVFFLGSFSLGYDNQTIYASWDQVIEMQPRLEDIDPLQLFHQVGLFSLASLIVNIASLSGVIFMWRLNKTGLLIYAISEVTSKFLLLMISLPGQNKSVADLIIFLVIDSAFILMYAINFRNIERKKNTAVNL
jgi:hypothetical protein